MKYLGCRIYVELLYSTSTEICPSENTLVILQGGGRHHMLQRLDSIDIALGIKIELSFSFQAAAQSSGEVDEQLESFS